MEKCSQKDLLVSDKFGININCLATYFLKQGARISLKVGTKVSQRGTKMQKFKGFFSKAKTEECDQKDSFVSDKFGIIFLEVGAPVSSKIAMKGSFRGEESYENLDFQAIFFIVKTEESNWKD